MKRGDNWMTKAFDFGFASDWLRGGVISLQTQLKIALRFKCQILVGWVEIWIWEMAPFGLPGPVVQNRDYTNHRLGLIGD